MRFQLSRIAVCRGCPSGQNFVRLKETNIQISSLLSNVGWPKKVVLLVENDHHKKKIITFTQMIYIKINEDKKTYQNKIKKHTKTYQVD